MSSINLGELQRAINRLLDQLSAAGIQEVVLDQPYYWKVLDDEKYIMSSKPNELGIGDLAFEAEAIRCALDPDEPPPKLLLVSLAALLSHVGSRENHY